MLLTTGSACGSAEAPPSLRSIDGATPDTTTVNGSVRLAYSLDLPSGRGRRFRAMQPR